MNSNKIFEYAEGLVNNIQKYSMSQKTFWQKIPLLALTADGRTGYNEHYSLAYEWGFWAIGKNELGHYKIFIDLETGKLVNAYKANESLFIDERGLKICSNIFPANKKDILNLAFNLEEIDAKKIINNLENECKKEYYKLYNPVSQERWRNKVIQLNKLSENYQRIR